MISFKDVKAFVKKHKKPIIIIGVTGLVVIAVVVITRRVTTAVDVAKTAGPKILGYITEYDKDLIQSVITITEANITNPEYQWINSSFFGSKF